MSDNAVSANSALEKRIAISIGNGQLGEINASLEECSQTLHCMHDHSAICQYGDVAGTLTERFDSSPCADRGMNMVCAGFMGGQGSKAGGIGYSEEISPTLKASLSGGNAIPDVVCAQVSPHDEIAENISPTIKNRDYKDHAIVCVQQNQLGEVRTGDVCGTLNTNSNASGRNPPICFQQNTRNEVRKMQSDGQVAGALSAERGTKQQNYLCFDARGNGDGKTAPTMTGDHQNRVTDYTAVAVAENIIGRKAENGGNGVGAQEEIAYTQNATGVMGGASDATVRRLLPVECERLMGFPDNWTQIQWKGKPADECPDSPRYKACGNSMCVNVMRWIGMRIEMVERKTNGEKK